MSVPGDGDPVVRSEEEHVFERRWWPEQLVRVRKTIVTEEHTVTLPVRREEITIETVELGGGPESQPRSSPARHPEGGYVFTVYEEEIEVRTRIVARERVRLVVERETFVRQFDDTLRREEIVIDERPLGGDDRGTTPGR